MAIFRTPWLGSFVFQFQSLILFNLDQNTSVWLIEMNYCKGLSKTDFKHECKILKL